MIDLMTENEVKALRRSLSGEGSSDDALILSKFIDWYDCEMCKEWDNKLQLYVYKPARERG